MFHALLPTNVTLGKPHQMLFETLSFGNSISNIANGYSWYYSVLHSEAAAPEVVTGKFFATWGRFVEKLVAK